ncbi:MAG: hypothetical protein IPJ65_05405 [Archangiaceae bacterium]|nr:hypothetical protein [Archangiaceae bacterium]
MPCTLRVPFQVPCGNRRLMGETPTGGSRSRRIVAWVRAHWGLLVAGAVGAGWFLNCAARLLNPFAIDSLLVDDWSTHELGWLFFRHESFHLPLGRIEGLLYPLGTTLGYTDSIPLVALVLRPLSFLLPTDFQFIGPFVFACFVLNGVAGAWVVKAVSPRQVDQALGGGLVALLPVLLHRIGHPSLCAQGLLLIPIGLALRKAADARSAWRSGLASLGVVALAAGLHPYLAVMVLVVAAGVPVKLWLVDRQLSWAKAFALVIAMPISCLALFALFGYFVGGVERVGAGFGGFSADLGTLVNPLEFSRWLKPRPQGGLQYEGFAYLGVGMLVAVAASAAALVLRFRETRSLPWLRVLPLLPGVALTAAFALASTWTLWGQPVWDLTSLYAKIPPGVVGPFRSSGRFIWPLMYAVAAFGVVGVVRLWRDRPFVSPALLGLCIALQLGDVTAASVANRFKAGSLTRFTHPAWNTIDGKYQHLDLVPAEVWSICGGRVGYRAPTVIALAYHAYLHHLTINSGYVARWSPDQPQVCAREAEKVQRGELDPGTVYVVWPDIAQQLVQLGASCGAFDGVLACVRPAVDDDFARALRASHGQ